MGSSLQAKLIAVRRVVIFAKDLRVAEVEFEGDSMLAIAAIQQEGDDTSI